MVECLPAALIALLIYRGTADHALEDDQLFLGESVIP
jgi:hypothetical protein